MAVASLTTLEEVSLVVLCIVLFVLAHEVYINWAGIVRTWDHVRLFKYFGDTGRLCRKCGATHVAYTVRTDEGASIIGWWRVNTQGNNPKCRCTLYVRPTTQVTPEDKKDETV